jgi:hypothetical protein
LSKRRHAVKKVSMIVVLILTTIFAQATWSKDDKAVARLCQVISSLKDHVEQLKAVGVDLTALREEYKKGRDYESACNVGDVTEAIQDVETGLCYEAKLMDLAPAIKDGYEGTYYEEREQGAETLRQAITKHLMNMRKMPSLKDSKASDLTEKAKSILRSLFPLLGTYVDCVETVKGEKKGGT